MSDKKVLITDDAVIQGGNLSRLREMIQSSHISFLIGSGCSRPYLSTLDGIEANISKAEKDGDSVAKIKELRRYFEDVMLPCLAILNNGEGLTGSKKAQFSETSRGYAEFFSTINSILVRRKMNLLSKQVNIFTTNIDVFMEKTLEDLGVEYNDGFKGHLNPSFAVSNFHKSVNQVSTHFSNVSEIPTFNIIKLHGSLSWAKDPLDPGEITYSKLGLLDTVSLVKDDDANFEQEYKKLQIVNPTKKKFEDTVIDLTYYELMRIYSSHLEKEDSLLFVIGFSMEDEHIRKITKRAADSNPTLQIFILCHDGNISGNGTATHERCKEWFKDAQYRNVRVVTPPEGEKFTLESLSKGIFSDVLTEEIEPKESKELTQTKVED